MGLGCRQTRYVLRSIIIINSYVQPLYTIIHTTHVKRHIHHTPYTILHHHTPLNNPYKPYP
ncbi:hypothetical protein EON63_17935 [archaeon]|nr:MAG: hypothetical protein EON63_17935 [archaeon]